MRAKNEWNERTNRNHESQKSLIRSALILDLICLLFFTLVPNGFPLVPSPWPSTCALSQGLVSSSLDDQMIFLQTKQKRTKINDDSFKFAFAWLSLSLSEKERPLALDLDSRSRTIFNVLFFSFWAHTHKHYIWHFPKSNIIFHGPDTQQQDPKKRKEKKHSS